MSKFKIIAKEYAEATSIFVDIWETKIKCDEDKGDIIDVDKNNAKKSIFEKTQRRELTKPFINYFSLGYDARVGFGKYIY